MTAAYPSGHPRPVLVRGRHLSLLEKLRQQSWVSLRSLALLLPRDLVVGDSHFRPLLGLTRGGHLLPSLASSVCW